LSYIGTVRKGFSGRAAEIARVWARNRTKFLE